MFFTEITDDLTGAVDSGSYFTSRGQSLRIFTDGNYVPPRCSGEIHSFNLSSRNTDKPLARKLHYDLMRKIPESGDDIFMKKIGTGFRGNDPYELEGLLEARPNYNVFIIDNAPDLGTFTLYGNQFCEGEILHKSLYAADPISPPTESYIPDILAKDTSLPVGLVDIDAVKSGEILEAVDKQIADGKKIIVFDAITKRDTINIISSLMPAYRNVFWTGSLGIADGLAEVLYGPKSVSYKPHARDIRCLCFSASDYAVAKRQIAYSQALGLNVLRVDVDAFIDGKESVISDAAQTAVCMLRNHNVMIAPKIEKYSRKPGSSIKILDCIGSVAKMVCESGIDFDRLLVVGGETAQRIFNRLHAGCLDLGQAIEPGVAEGRIMDGQLGGKEFVIKGGSMGSEEVLEKMMCRRGNTDE